MNVMISQPMRGLKDEEIAATRERAVKVLEERGYEVLDTFFTDEWHNSEQLRKYGVVHTPVYLLSESLQVMSLCHAVYFCKGWEKARGCRIEHDIATQYGLQIIEEEEKNG